MKPRHALSGWTLRGADWRLATGRRRRKQSAWGNVLTRYAKKTHSVRAAHCREDAAARDLAHSIYAASTAPQARRRRVSSASVREGDRSKAAAHCAEHRKSFNRYSRTKRLVVRLARKKVKMRAVRRFRAGPLLRRIAPGNPHRCGPGFTRPARTDRMVSLGPSTVLSRWRTLAEIARMLGCVARITIKPARWISWTVVCARRSCGGTMKQQGCHTPGRRRALEVDVRDLQVDIAASLAQESPA